MKSLSIKKRIRQSQKKYIMNSRLRSRSKTAIKRIKSEIKNKRYDEISNLIKVAYSMLDKAYKKGVYHKNYVARKKSKIMKEINRSKKS